MLKGVLFDLGDTLQEYHSEDWGAIVTGLNKDLYAHLSSAGHSNKLPPLDAFLGVINARIRAHRANSSATLRSHSMQDVLEAYFKEASMHDLRAGDYIEPWYRGLTDLVFMPPDTKPTLQTLKERGLKLGLVSNTGWPAATHDMDLERFGIISLLDCRIYSSEAGWEKPAPQIFLQALHCMGLEPEETAFVGDFLRYDVAGAQSVGMKGIWKRMPERPEGIDDQTIAPDGTIIRLKELPALLDKLYA